MSKSRMPEESNGNGVRDRIARCALEMFATKGFAATSMREIVEAVGVTKPTLYYYYGSKEALYKTLLKEYLADFINRMGERAAEPGNLEERLERVAGLYLEGFSNMPHLARLFHRAMVASPEATPEFDVRNYVQRSSEMVMDILREGAVRGEMAGFLARPLMVVLFHGLIVVFMMRQAMGFVDVLNGAKARLIVKMFLNGVRGFEAAGERGMEGALEKEVFSCV